MKQGGHLYIISAPSGAGKTSMVTELLKQCVDIRLSVSHTTRPPRPKETEGIHYHFIPDQRFSQMVEEHQFVEHADVFDHRYGTAKSSVEKQLALGLDVILEIDWQGARQVRSAFPRSKSIFILPPSKQALLERLKKRGQDSDETIRRRMSEAETEMSHFDEFDYLLINDIFNHSVAQLISIIDSNRLCLSIQQKKYSQILRQLLD